MNLGIGLWLNLGAGGASSVSQILAGLVLGLPLNEVSGNALNVVSGGPVLVPANNPVGVSGPGSALVRQFVAASSESMAATDNAAFHLATSFTLMCSVKFTSLSATGIILVLKDGSGTEYELSIAASGAITFEKNDPSLSTLSLSTAGFVGTNKVVTGVWYTCAVRCDGTYLYISLNAGPEERVAWVPGFYRSAGSFTIGGITSAYLDGDLSNILVWSRNIGSDWVAGLVGDASVPVGSPFAGIAAAPRAPILTREDSIFSDGTRYAEFPLVTRLEHGANAGKWISLVANNLTDEGADSKVAVLTSSDGKAWTFTQNLATNASVLLTPSSPILELTIAPPNTGGAAGDLLAWVLLNAAAGSNGTETQYRSTDGGTTWTSDITFPTFGYTNGVSGFGRAYVLASGRIIRPYYATNQSFIGFSSAFIVRSDDGGETWTLGGMMFDGTASNLGGLTPGPYTEASIAFVEDGTLIAVCRVEGGANGLMSTSADDGDTWTPFTTLPFNVISPALHYAPNGTLYLFAGDTYRAFVGGVWGPPHNVGKSTREYITAQADAGVLRVYTAWTNPVGGVHSIYHTEWTFFEAPILSATAGTAENVLAWNAVPGASSYSVQRGTVSGGPYTTVYTGTALTFTDTGRTNGTEYFYVVSATNAPAAPTQAITLQSTEVNATPVAPPEVTILANLVPVWQMEGATGASETDANAGIYTLTDHAGNVGSVAGKFGNARQTTKATGNYLLSANTGLQTHSGAFELNLWVKPRSTATQTIVSKYASGGANGEWVCWQDATHLNFICEGVGTVSVPIASFPVSAYSMLSIGYDGTKAFMAINNGTPVSVTGTFAVSNAAVPLAFGLDGVTTGAFSECDYDNCGYWIGKSLTATERTWFFDSGAGRQWDATAKVWF